jgi:hypothetical protein
MLSFIFLWIVFGQVGLIALSWGAAKGPDETNEVDDASSAGDEEE